MSTTSRPTSRPSGQGSDRPAGPPGRPPRGSLPSARPIGNSPRSPLRGLPDGPQGPRPSGAGAPAPRLAMSRGACRVGGVPWAFPVGLAPRPARRPRVLATACRLVARGTRPAARPPAPTRGSRRLRRIPLPVPQPAEGAFGIRNRSGRAPCRPRLVAFPVALPAGGAPRATGEGERRGRQVARGRRNRGGGLRLWLLPPQASTPRSPSNSRLPSRLPCASSTARSGWGIRPSTLRPAFRMPAMSRALPLTASA